MPSGPIRRPTRPSSGGTLYAEQKYADAASAYGEAVGLDPENWGYRLNLDKIKIKCNDCGSVMSRIPEVGNPWLDAGIVSFSTLSYREDPEYWKQWFPANWISESFPGQCRNWFYSLLAMSTVLENKPPFLENFGYASLLAEDGSQMHKSSGNSIEFNDAADKMGVDTMRWLYCAQKPENDLLFGFNRAEDVRRRFIIPLWNVYSFFSNYASLDNWTPSAERFTPGLPEGFTPTSNNPLDQWIRARLNQVVAQVTQNFTNSDAYSATLVFESLLDDLSNWYVRRSRRRHSRVARSNAKLLRRLGATVRLAGPPKLMPGDSAHLNVDEAIEGADAVMMLRVQRERLEEELGDTPGEYLRLYGLTAGRLAKAAPDAVVLHPGPMNRGVEISDAIADDSERSLITAQVEMGVAIRMACLELVIEKDES